MTIAFRNAVYEVGQWALQRSIQVHQTDLPVNTAGEFDGSSVILNVDYSPEERAYYLNHALGSIVCWSIDESEAQTMFDELAVAKEIKLEDPERLDKAIERYRDFEIRSSAFGASLFENISASDLIPGYTNFMQADLEALVQFHRDGTAPLWADFFARWNHDVLNGHRRVDEFDRMPVPVFKLKTFARQRILQRREIAS